MVIELKINFFLLVVRFNLLTASFSRSFERKLVRNILPRGVFNVQVGAAAWSADFIVDDINSRSRLKFERPMKFSSIYFIHNIFFRRRNFRFFQSRKSPVFYVFSVFFTWEIRSVRFIENIFE